MEDLAIPQMAAIPYEDEPYGRLLRSDEISVGLCSLYLEGAEF